MKKIGLPFFVHWLAYGFMLDDQEKFRRFLRVCKDSGADGVELPWIPLMKLSPQAIGEELLKADITKVSFCCFFGGNDLDPLRDQDAAIDRLAGCARYALALREMGIDVLCIDGPWAYQVGKRYHGSAVRSGVRRLMSKAARAVSEDYWIPMCLETLREEEDAVFNGSMDAADVVASFKMIPLRLHLDTFHMQCRGEDDDIYDILSRGAVAHGWLHASGTDRHTPGHPKDTVPWSVVHEGLLDPKNRPMAICFEAFSPDFRTGVPEIGKGFPKDLPPAKAIALARKTLEKHGIV